LVQIDPYLRRPCAGPERAGRDVLDSRLFCRRARPERLSRLAAFNPAGSHRAGFPKKAYNSRTMHLHTRREFLPLLCSLAAPSKAQPFRYDLEIKGGRVIDPSQALSAPLDVAISGDKVARVEANIPSSDARLTLDARGK